ncbi:MAG: DUF1127 domain-containing protein [Pikeienuella sp.]
MTQCIASKISGTSWFSAFASCIQYTRDLYETADQIDRLSDQELRDIGLHRGSLI